MNWKNKSLEEYLVMPTSEYCSRKFLTFFTMNIFKPSSKIVSMEKTIVILSLYSSSILSIFRIQCFSMAFYIGQKIRS